MKETGQIDGSDCIGLPATGACGNKNEVHQTSSSVKTSQSPGSKAASSSKESKTPIFQAQLHLEKAQASSGSAFYNARSVSCETGTWIKTRTSSS